METDSDPSSTRPPALEYGQRPKLAWFSRHRGKLIALSLVIAIAIPVWWTWQSLKHRTLWLYWSHRAAAYVMPASGELVVTDPIRVARLLAGDPNYALVSLWRSATQPAVPAAVHYPRALQELQKLDPRTNVLMPLAPPHWPIAFMGTLRRSDGTPRLVIVQRCEFEYQGIDKQFVAVLPLPGWFEPLPRGTYSPGGRMAIGMGNGYIEELLLGFASTDPADPTHLIFPFTIMKGNIMKPGRQEVEKGSFDAYLRNDDSLLFRNRADATRSIALRLQKETVLAGAPAPTPPPRGPAPTSAPRPAGR